MSCCVRHFKHEALRHVAGVIDFCVGKGTLFKLFQARFPDTMSCCVSHTTRAPRHGEIDGVHYHFVRKEQFVSAQRNGEFLEVTEFADRSYATSYRAIRDVFARNQICMLEIHYTATQQIKSMGYECNCVFVTTSGGCDTLRERLKARGTEDAEQVESRLNAAQKEFDFLEENPDFFDAIIYNDRDIERTLEQLVSRLSHWYPNILSAPRADGRPETRPQHCTLL